MALATVAVACYRCSCSYNNLFRMPIIELSYKHNLIISVMLLQRSIRTPSLNWSRTSALSVQTGRLIYSLCLSCRLKDHWASSPLHNGIRISGILSWGHCDSSKCFSSAPSSWLWSLTHSFSNFVYGFLQGTPWSCTDWSSGGWLPSQPSASITPTCKTG